MQDQQSQKNTPPGSAVGSVAEPKPWRAGITPASVLACIMSMLALAMVIQYAEIVLGVSGQPAEYTLAVPAMWLILVLVAVVGICWTIGRLRILSRPELLCVFYAMLISAPLMTQGFWHRVIAISATLPRSTDQWDKLDGYDDKLWPHGPNLLAGKLSDEAALKASVRGTVEWKPTEYEEGVTAALPVMSNKEAGRVSSVRLRVPVVPRDVSDTGIVRNEPYIANVLVRATGLAPESKYFCRIYEDGGSQVQQEILSTSEGQKKTALHKMGFTRRGSYGVKFPGSVKEYIEVELGISGVGTLQVADAKLMNVSALEGIFKGRAIVRESAYAALPEAERANLIVKPDNMWSWAGLKFVIAGYIPVREWVTPGIAWGGFLMLVMVAFMAVNSIMRKQWMDNERYLMPLARVSQAILGPDPDAPGGGAPAWRNGYLWAGVALGLVFMGMKIWHRVNASVPDVTITRSASEFFTDAAWGKTFQFNFEINILFLALCLFMELNVLFSIFVGFMAYRAQFYVGQKRGWSNVPDYPLWREQLMASTVTYGLMVLALSWRYIGRVVKAAITNDKAASAGELMSYRTAFLVLGACFGLGALWATWMGMSILGLLTFMAGIVLVGLVAAKFRTECGTPWSEFSVYNLALLLAVAGAVPMFGSNAMIFCYAASFFLGATFFVIPGGQMEMIELGRRWRVKPSHIRTTLVLAMLGGLVLGGWAFLSNSYSMGGETVRYNWAYDSKPWFFHSYNTLAMQASQPLQDAAPAGSAAKSVDPAWYAYGFSAVVTVIVTVLRQMFSWFWFHPIGFILGPTAMSEKMWGSALVAFAVRWFVLWLGGAATIRNKLQPFALGLLIGGLSGEFMSGAMATYYRSINMPEVYGG